MNTKNPSAPTAKTATPAATDKPVKNLRIGNISAAVWENHSDKGRTFHTVTFQRSYRGEDQQYRNTSSFDRDDLLVLAKLADQAHSFIIERLAELRESDSDQG